MKSNYLLPPCFKRIGWILFVPFAVLGIWEIYTYGLILGEYGVPGLPVLPQWKGAHSIIMHFPFSWDGWDELLIIGLIVSLIFIAF